MIGMHFERAASQPPLQPLFSAFSLAMAESVAMTSSTAALLSEQLPDPFPRKLRIGSPKYAYEYTWQYGKVWRCIRKADGHHETTGPTDKLFLIKLDTPDATGPEAEGFTWMAVHSPENVPDAASLLADNRVVFGSSDNVLEAGWHMWSSYDSDQKTWQELGQFETKIL